ncbi:MULTISPECIES: hypothetical protein [unclassified Nitratiruptor]|uniref:hypothetical protein n=1 Tax=unclassified Nitratiruptor TaxID=2624044 RepID=UPI0019163407|nr:MULTISPECIES: hypothetical protein [unclassified Nitratiruptor]BCD59590.1 hypothetical protein NitYY0810_C0341 [Nitratiruptor sp. YY08-10]BCD63514.1 hypothetical protein NitYY0814_C0341 [Nitratiruptor sp. YY08-14]BCD83066.1 hypothetical protein NrS2_16 [Nitratiruptor phage NrS-2]BCD83132.1 hypothetical protein NrS3_16 [Nitratiruptor phage NrS-3]
MNVQKGKIYRLKDNIYGFDKEVKVVSIDSKYIKLIGLHTKDTMFLSKETFERCYKEVEQ